MNKVFTLIFALCLIFFMAGCGSSPSPIQTEETQNGLPNIVKNANAKRGGDILIGIGSAKMASQSQSRTMAESRARAEIARAMDTMVQQMVRDYTAGSEVDKSAVVAFQEDISIQLTKAHLQGAVVENEDWIDGTYYVVMRLSKSDVVREINQAQAAAKLKVPAMLSFDAEARMNEAFERAAAEELRVADR